MKTKLIAIMVITGLVLGSFSISNYVQASPEEIGKLVPPGKKLPPTSPPGLEKEGVARVISETTSEKEISDIRQKGCSVIHRLNHATSFFCPTEMVDTLENVRPVKIYQPHDLFADQQIQADRVWNELNFDGSGVTVAVLDTGVQSTHVELTDSVFTTSDFVGDFPDGDWKDFNGHGTHVSGIITGNGVYNLQGTSNKATGVAPGAEIIVGKVCGLNGCPEDAILAGIIWAQQQGADVINMSLGGGLSGENNCDNDGDSIVNQVNAAAANGVVVVISSGNDGDKQAVSYPGCASGAIAVGAVNNNDQDASFSNAGPALDVVAPGVNILSSWSCNDLFANLNCSSTWYYYADGTSMSAPHVTGLVALLLEKNPSLTVAEVKQALYTTAIPVGPNDGNGRVDAFAAVNSVSSDTVLPPIDNDGDGYDSDVDCNDNAALIYPGAPEIAGNGIDEDCSGSDMPLVNVGDLDASKSGKKNWTAHVTITVYDHDDNFVEGVAVLGDWTGSATGPSNCITNSEGQCNVSKTTKGGSLTFSIYDITGDVFYNSGLNTDPDVPIDSDGTSITITKDDGGGSGGGSGPGGGGPNCETNPEHKKCKNR